MCHFIDAAFQNGAIQFCQKLPLVHAVPLTDVDLFHDTVGLSRNQDVVVRLQGALYLDIVLEKGRLLTVMLRDSPVGS